jgi:hypothetical protein
LHLRLVTTHAQFNRKQRLHLVEKSLICGAGKVLKKIQTLGPKPQAVVCLTFLVSTGKHLTFLTNLFDLNQWQTFI